MIRPSGIESLVNVLPSRSSSYSPRAVTPSHSSWNRNHRHCVSRSHLVEFMISISIGLRRKGRRDDRPTVSTVELALDREVLVTPVTFRQMFTFKTTSKEHSKLLQVVFRNRRTRQLAYLSVQRRNQLLAYHSTTGIWLQGAVEFAIL